MPQEKKKQQTHYMDFKGEYDPDAAYSVNDVVSTRQERIPTKEEIEESIKIGNEILEKLDNALKASVKFDKSVDDLYDTLKGKKKKGE